MVFGWLTSKRFPLDERKAQDQPDRRGHGNLLYSNWLNYFVYQTTPYDIMAVGQESTR